VRPGVWAVPHRVASQRAANELVAAPELDSSSSENPTTSTERKPLSFQRLSNEIARTTPRTPSYAPALGLYRDASPAAVAAHQILRQDREHANSRGVNSPRPERSDRFHKFPDGNHACGERNAFVSPVSSLKVASQCIELSPASARPVVSPLSAQARRITAAAPHPILRENQDSQP
jgi:hypothetical protein